MTNPIFCIASTRLIADNIIARLKTSGIDADNVSYLLPVTPDVHEFASEMESRFSNGVMSGAGMGGSIDGMPGLSLGSDLPLFPGIAPDPMLASLSSIIDKVVGGNVGGVLTGMGLAAYEAGRYEARLCDGNILICVRTSNSSDADHVRQIFLSEHGTDISKGYEPTAGDAKASGFNHRIRVSSWDDSDGVQDSF